MIVGCEWDRLEGSFGCKKGEVGRSENVFERGRIGEGLSCKSFEIFFYLAGYGRAET